MCEAAFENFGNVVVVERVQYLFALFVAAHEFGPAQDAQLRVVCGGRETRLRAIVDTGCRAVDPETLLPVIVLPAGAVRPPEGCRPLWVKTAAGRTSLSCFTPEAVFINGIPVSACVATAPGESLPHALIPVALCAGRRIG